MNKHLWFLTVLAAITSFLLQNALPAAGGERWTMVGNEGLVTLHSETKVGDLTLMPGEYRVQHRAEGPGHFMQFTRANPDETLLKDSTWQVIKAKCILEFLNSTVAQTAVLSVKDDDGIERITRIKVKGENVVHHLF